MKKEITIWYPANHTYFDMPLGLLKVEKVIHGGKVHYVLNFPNGKMEKIESTELGYEQLKSILSGLFNDELEPITKEEYDAFMIKFNDVFGPTPTERGVASLHKTAQVNPLCIRTRDICPCAFLIIAKKRMRLTCQSNCL